jgi:hypothetical protein
MSVPQISIRRRRVLSATRAKRPLGEILIFLREEKVADVPTPSAVPLTLPASVETAEVERIIFRMTLLETSAMSAKRPSGEMLTDFGLSKSAFVPIPLVEPVEAMEPATVVTAVVERSTERIILFHASATKANCPLGEILMPSGDVNFA